MTQKESRLDLSGQNLTKVPDSVFAQTDLTYLDLGSSNVTFYPPLSGLTDSNANQISVLSEQIGHLTHLKTLVLNSNKLTYLPASLAKLTQLEVLDLSLNKELDIVSELPKIKMLANLKVLKIVDAKLDKDGISLVKQALPSKTTIITTPKEYLESVN